MTFFPPHGGGGASPLPRSNHPEHILSGGWTGGEGWRRARGQRELTPVYA